MDPYSKPVPPILIVELSEKCTNALDNLSSNQTYPTIDPEALMSAMFDQIHLMTQEASEGLNPADREYEARYLLHNTLGHQADYSQEVLDNVARDTLVVIDEVWKTLETHGVFIDGAQPYEFQSFLSHGTAVLRKAKVSDY